MWVLFGLLDDVSFCIFATTALKVISRCVHDGISVFAKFCRNKRISLLKVNSVCPLILRMGSYVFIIILVIIISPCASFCFMNVLFNVGVKRLY